jgi:hypothetical protein
MSGSQSQSTNSVTAPYGPQNKSLKFAYKEADKAYGQASQAQAPENFVAQFNPDQLNTFNSMINYGNASNAAAQNAATGGALSQAGVGGVEGALSKLNGFQPTDATGLIINNASQFANNPHMDGMVDAAMRDARRQVAEQDIPQLDRSAALGGNTNNSRTALAMGLVERGLAEKTADVSAGLRGAAFNNGLNLASDNNQFNINSFLQSAAAAGGIGNTAAGIGVGATSGSIKDQTDLFKLAAGGGAGLQGADQANLDNQMAQYQSGVNAPFAPLQNYMSTVNPQVWGTNTSGTQTTTPSTYQVVGGLMGAGGSLLGSKTQGTGLLGFM